MSSGMITVGYVAGWSRCRAPGLARYADELLDALRRVAPELDLVVLGRRRAGPARITWSQTAVPWRLRRERVDVCHATGAPGPLAWPGPQVLTLHDLSLLREPGVHPHARVRTGVPLLRRSLARASAVVVPSHATAHDASRLFDLAPDRLHVIPEAAAARFRPITDAATLDAVARRHGLRRGYVLAVGTLEPRKNLGRLVDAWVRLRAGGWDGQLVLAGAVGWGAAPLLERLADPSLAGGVRILGRVADPELPSLISLAGVVAYPSLLEGFGLPVIEALACGTPVVVADRGAPAEVAGDAAVLVDPLDPVAIAAGLDRALAPGAERERLRAAGPARAAAFSWDAAARATARVYTLAAGAGA